MSFETILYDVDGHVARITLNRPFQMNVFNRQMRLDLYEALRKANADDRVRVIILTGAGQCLSAGMDLAEASVASADDLTRILSEEFGQTFMTIIHSEKPSICAFRGAAVGIAAAYALSCDITIMSENSYMYMAYSDIGLIPDGGLTWHFVRLLGYKRAFRLFVDPTKMLAKECVDLGLATMVVPDDLLQETAENMAVKLSSRSSLAHGLLKKSLYHAFENDLESSILYETECQKSAADSAYFKSSAAAFLKKDKK